MKSEHIIKEEDHHWTSEEKIKWIGYGEWVEELDSVEIEYLGYDAIVIRVLSKEPFAKEETYFGGHFCGYVRIPESHPLYGNKKIDIVCHGGITSNESHEEHWIGFDCSHSFDFVPSLQLMRKKHNLNYTIPKDLEDFSLFNPIYRNMQYCIDECKKIIDQLITEKEQWEKNKQYKKKSTSS